jgi:hypothetical protein
LERLHADIKLPAKREIEVVEDYSPSLFKRWLPALSVAIWFLACLVILALQSSALSKLRVENAGARAAAIEAQRKLESPLSNDAERSRLRADAEEAQKLRAEIGQLTAQLAELEQLKAENQRLSAELRQSRGSAAAPEQDFFTHAAQKHENAKCINNLKQIGLGARIWANEHNDMLPERFDQMQAELPDQSILFCRTSEGTVAYEIISPGAPETDPEVVYARCPRHNNVVLCDGSAHILGTSRKLVVRADGKTVIGR